jgi:hypothetical protein
MVTLFPILSLSEKWQRRAHPRTFPASGGAIDNLKTEERTDKNRLAGLPTVDVGEHKCC